MIAEAIQSISALTSRAAEPKRLPIDDPRHVDFVVNGEVKSFDVPASPRDHELGQLADLVALANRFAEDGEGPPSVWYSEDAVVLVIDDAGHRVERARLPLVVSDVFARLVALRRSPREAWMEQKPFVRLLRVELAGTLDPVELLNAVRSLKFSSTAEARGEVRRAQESMGREINSRVDAAAEIPEEVRLLAPVYKTAGEDERFPVRCTVEVEPAEGRLQLLPLPDEVERVRQAAVRSIGERLAAALDAKVPAYYGKP
jgi:hypothetical protein